MFKCEKHHCPQLGHIPVRKSADVKFLNLQTSVSTGLGCELAISIPVCNQVLTTEHLAACPHCLPSPPWPRGPRPKPPGLLLLSLLFLQPLEYCCLFSLSFNQASPSLAKPQNPPRGL